MKNLYDVELVRLTGEKRIRPHGPMIEILKWGNAYVFTDTLTQCLKRLGPVAKIELNIPVTLSLN